MQIALTKKLANAMGIKLAQAKNDAEPLFSWTANWTNTFHNHKEDTVVMINNANRFTVTIYGVRRNQFKDVATKMTAAIRHTLLAMNIDPEVVDEYLHLSGEVEFISNNDRAQTARLNHQGLHAAFVIGRRVNESMEEIRYEDTLGQVVSTLPVNLSKSLDEGFVPAKEMVKALEELTGKPAYRYRAFELLVTLDLDRYQAKRRLIVPADIGFEKLHRLLQQVFAWKNCHLHDYTVFDNTNSKPVARLVMSKEDLAYDSSALVETRHRLSDFFPEYSQMLYTYDMGDTWEHVIDFVREIEEHDEEAPYLLEAIGQAPPEDVGGVPGYLDFLEIMFDPDHPDYTETKEWAGYWKPELRDFEARPRVIDWL